MKKDLYNNKNMISVIIPVYNVEMYLEKCLDSVINQTYQNLEIIIVNDGSTDNSGRICDYYQGIDSRVKVYHKKNEGLSSARNVGLQYAKGEFIGFVDSDDYIDLDMYECMINEIEDDVDIIVCGRRMVFPREMHQNDKVTFCTPKCIKMDNVTAMQNFLGHETISFAAWDKIYRRELFENVKFPYKRISEDIPVTYAMIAKSRHVVHLGKAKYNHFYRSTSISGREFYFRQIDSVLFTGEICKDVAKRYPQLLMQAEGLYLLCALSIIRKLQFCPKRFRYKDVERRLLKMLWHMYPRILVNPCVLPEQKRQVFVYMLGKMP